MLGILWLALSINSCHALSIASVNVEGASNGASSFTLDLGVNMNRDASDVTSVDAALAISDSLFFNMGTVNLQGETGFFQQLLQIEQRSITSGNVYRVQFRPGGSTSGCGVPNGCSSLPGTVVAQSNLFNVEAVLPTSTLLTDPNPGPSTTSKQTTTTTTQTNPPPQGTSNSAPSIPPSSNSSPGSNSGSSISSSSSLSISISSGSFNPPSSLNENQSTVPSPSAVNTDQVAPSTDSASSTDSQHSPTSPSTKSSSKPIGAIVGGVVGGLAFLAIAALLAFCLFRCRNRTEEEEDFSDITYVPVVQKSHSMDAINTMAQGRPVNTEKTTHGRPVAIAGDGDLPSGNAASHSGAISTSSLPQGATGSSITPPALGALNGSTGEIENTGDDELEQLPPEEIRQELRILREEVRRFRTGGPTPEWLDGLPDDIPPPEYMSTPDSGPRS